MSDDSYLLDSKDKKKEKSATRWFGRLLKLAFLICAFILVILTVLANMGGTSDMLSEGVGQTISKIFGGRPVTMRRLVHMGFFPTVALDVEGIKVFANNEDVVPLIRLEKFQAYMPFWNVATSTPRLKTLYIEGFKSIKGVFLPEEISVEKIFIDHDIDAGIAKLRGNGRVGVHSWDFNAELEVVGSNSKYEYMLSSSSTIVFDIADLHFDGVFSRASSSYYKLENFNLEFGDKRIGGDLVLSSLGKKLLKVKGTLKTKGDRTILSPDLVVNFLDNRQLDISGIVSSDKLVLDDLVGESSVFSIFARLREIIGHKAIQRGKEGEISLLGRNNIKIDFNLKNVDVNAQIRENMNFEVVQNNGRIKIGPVLSAGNMVMPVIMFLYKQDEEKIISIIQDGRFDMEIVKSWLKNLPKRTKNQGYIDVECGIAEFSRIDGGMKIDSFGIKAKSHDIRVREKSIPYEMKFSDLHFVESKGRANLAKVELPKGLHDFVQGSFQKSKDGSPCSSFVFQKEEIVDDTPVEQENSTQDTQQ